jgi:TonB family protein
VTANRREFLMAPLTKESVDVSNSRQELAVRQSNAQPKPSSDDARSDAVSLEVPAKIYGSRIRAAAGGNTPQTEPFSEETNTMIVFPRGGVLKMATAVNVGQLLVLTNLKSRQDAICRVVNVRSFPNKQAYVEIAFTQPQAAYWGVHFTSEGGTSTREPSTPAAQLEKRVAPEVLRAPAPAPNAPVSKPVERNAYLKDVSPVPPPAVSAPPPAKPASVFASFGTQEKVQAAAAAMSAVRSLSSLLSVKQTYPTEQWKSEIAHSKSSETAAEAENLFRRDSSKVEIVAASVGSGSETKYESLSLDDAANPTVPLGSLAATSELATDSVDTIRQAFGPRPDVEIGRSTSSEPRQNRMLVAACVAVLFVTVAGCIWYFRPKAPRDTAAANPDTSSLEQTPRSDRMQPLASKEPLPAGLASSSTATPDARLRPTPSRETSAAIGTLHAAGAKKDDSVPARSGPPQHMLIPKVTKAHPVSSRRALNPQSPAPVLDATTLPSPQLTKLPGIASSRIAVPPPQAAEGPVPVGGAVKEPKLVSSLLPVYPTFAKQVHVEGDVVIDTQVDKNGRVARMKIVSGPMMLRQAALDAVRKWKYEPSQLDGQPIEVEMFVLIRFRL